MSSKTIKPVGQKILVKPSSTEHHVTDSGLVAVENQISEGVVVEVSDFLSELYKPGSVVLYPKGAGTNHLYKGEPHLWLNGQEFPDGDIWAIVSDDIIHVDKGDSL